MVETPDGKSRKKKILASGCYWREEVTPVSKHTLTNKGKWRPSGIRGEVVGDRNRHFCLLLRGKRFTFSHPFEVIIYNKCNECTIRILIMMFSNYNS